MAKEANIVEDGIDRLQSAFESVEDEFEKVQDRVEKGRKNIEKKVRSSRKDFEKETNKFQKRVESRRKNFEKQAEKRVKSFQKELRKFAVVQQIEEFADEATKRVEEGFDAILGGMNVATRSDIKKLDKKLNTISRKLKSLEKEPRKKAAPAKTEEAAA